MSINTFISYTQKENHNYRAKEKREKRLRKSTKIIIKRTLALLFYNKVELSSEQVDIKAVYQHASKTSKTT